MFTGIIEGAGILKQMVSRGEGKRLQIQTDLDLSSVKIGDSIAVNGACLTAVALEKHLFSVDMAPETVSRTTFKTLAAGARVNIERALRLSDRLDGHLVSGHIDGTGTILSKTVKSNAVILVVGVSQDLAADMIEKGSVAIDGISLTINRCLESEFEVSIIPHTAQVTTIGLKNAGDRVNIETDMIGKYVRKFMQKGYLGSQGVPSGKKDISMAFLAEKGFL